MYYIETKGITNMLNGIKSKAFLIGILVVSMLISGCGVKKDSDDKAILVNGRNIIEVNSKGKKNLLDKNYGEYLQYDPGNNLLIASGTKVIIYNLETGATTDIGLPDEKNMLYDFKYEGQKMVGLNAWYEGGKVRTYAFNRADDTLVVFTFDYETGELEDTTRYDIKRQ